MLQQVEQTILQKRLLRDGAKVLVAVSGGVDSIVLLEVLARLAGRHGWRLAVAHFNHKLRGRSSDADERFVLKTAAKLNLKCLTGRADVRQYARRHKLSIEMAARELRHKFLARTARKLKISTIALAHHADDQVELFFLRLLRGAGGEGLGGMRWRNPSPADPKIELVRPLLSVPKAALLEFARHERIAFRQDATNESRDILRNWIRNELLPRLFDRCGASIQKTIPRLMEILGAEADYVTEAARRWLAARRKRAFGRLPVAVQRRCIQLQLAALGITPGFDLVERLRLSPGRPVTVRQNMAVACDSDGAVHRVAAVQKAGAAGRFGPEFMRLELQAGTGEATFSGTRIRWRILAGGGRPPAGRHGQWEVFDADKVGSAVILRHWRAGDRFQPIGMASAVKLQDLFTNLKIGREQRHRLVVAATEAGEIFWVEGLRIGERFKLDKSTRRRLKWMWRRLPSGGC